MKKIKVGILGATGLVGQKLINILNRHPYFQIGELVASERSAGFTYGELIPSSIDFNPEASKLVVRTLTPKLESPLLFSCLDASLAQEWEPILAREHWVISNASSYRLSPNVPLIVPEANGKPMEKMLEVSASHLITNPNCVAAILAIALAPIMELVNLDKLQITTMQSISGAGYPGISALDITGNILPYIEGEEEKISSELKKIFNHKLSGNSKDELVISVRCFRVPVDTGHLISLFFSTKREILREEIVEAFLNFCDLKGNRLIDYREDLWFPQPKGHLSDMKVAVGHLKGENYQWQMTVLGNNLIRGAAGAALANAEYLYNLGKL